MFDCKSSAKFQLNEIIISQLYKISFPKSADLLTEQHSIYCISCNILGQPLLTEADYC